MLVHAPFFSGIFSYPITDVFPDMWKQGLCDRSMFRLARPGIRNGNCIMDMGDILLRISLEIRNSGKSKHVWVSVPSQNAEHKGEVKEHNKHLILASVNVLLSQL